MSQHPHASAQQETAIPTDVLERAAAEIERGRRVLITSHWRPDGDAIGCVIALREVLRALGKQVLAGLPDDIPARYRFMAEPEPLPNLVREAALAREFAPDLVIIADTSAKGQVEPLWPFLQECPARRLIVDHHVTHDIAAQAELYDTTAGATGLVLLDWFAWAGWEPNRAAAEALFVAMATDTGWFRFSSADARMYRGAARLIEQQGVRPDALYQKLYMQESPARMRLLGEMLGSLELHAGGRLGVCTITREMFARSGAQYSETEDLINEPQRIGAIRVMALLIEDPDGKTRISLRSKDGVNVAAIAQAFGGGGHERAAGARSAEGPMAVKAQVITAVGKALGAH